MSKRLRGVVNMVAALLLAGCPAWEAKRCTTSDECGPGATCVDGYCVVQSAGGGGAGGGMASGGGMAAGGGTGMGGGMTTDGGTGGGGGGGTSMERCDASLQCEAWEECRPTTTGGECTNADFDIVWLTPASGFETNDASVPARLAVTKRDGGTLRPAAVPVNGVSFTRNGNEYPGVLQLMAPGPNTFIAGWPDADSAASLTVFLDLDAPLVTVVVEDRPSALGDADLEAGAAWKKDEMAVVRITVDGGRPVTANDVRPAWDGGVVQELASSACAGPCAGNCRCVGIALSHAPLAGLRGAVNFTVGPIADSAGNQSALSMGAIPVTRLKWERQMSAHGVSTPLLPLAIAADGTVVWGVEEASGTSPRLQATSQDGGTRWTAITSGTITAGPAIGRAQVWVATDDTVESKLMPVSLVTGMQGTPACGGGSTFRGHVLLGVADGGLEVPLAVRNGRLNAGLSAASSCPVLLLSGQSGNVDPAWLATRSSSGAVELFSAYEGRNRLWKSALRVDIESWSPQGEALLPSGGGVQPRGLFIDGAGFAGGGGGVSGGGRMFATSAQGPLDGGTITSEFPATNASAPVVGNGFLLFGDSDGVLTRAPYNAGSFGMPDAGVSTSSNAGNLQAILPVLGNDGLLYVLGSQGRLTVRRAGSLSEEWNTTIPSVSSSAQLSQLALDVLRDPLAAKRCDIPLGVLYVLSRIGNTATLRAILVDSRGLDPLAHWPRYLRDNANSGNADSNLSLWSCP